MASLPFFGNVNTTAIRIMAFFRQELAIDLGTANTVIFKDDQVVLDEPSIIALESKTDKLYAIGNEALQRDRNRSIFKGILSDNKTKDTQPTEKRRRPEGRTDSERPL